ncbi:MAG: TraR/DksA C4-type zinc finger protein [Betaproteobacteria bacterium]
MFEKALRLQEAERAGGIAANSIAANRVEEHPDFDGKHCVDCEIEIPEARLAMGKVRCVDCQSLREKRRVA